jgi:hypothetical protein
MGNGSFVPSINVDGCIIEEQPDHLVLAVRVPKATIAANRALFAAMGARADVDGHQEKPGTRRRKTWRSLLSWRRTGM